MCVKVQIQCLPERVVGRIKQDAQLPPTLVAWQGEGARRGSHPLYRPKPSGAFFDQVDPVGVTVRLTGQAGR
jgi:hypothetical protein